MNNWQKYNLGLIFKPPHIEVKDDIEKIKSFVSILHGVLFARWTSDFDCKQETEFWYIICDTFTEIEDLSKNTRKLVRRGLKRTYIKKVDVNYIINYAYPVYIAAFNKYQGHVKPKSYKNFKNEYSKYTDSSWEFWAVFDEQTNFLIAFSRNQVVDGMCELCTTKFHPYFLSKCYPSEALFHVMNKYYLKEKGLKYVNDGARSISHETNIQSFLVDKFKFRKAYCELHLEYTFLLKLFLNIVTPFERIFDFIPLNLFKKVSILIKQEKIRLTFQDD